MTTDIQVQFGTDDGEKSYVQAVADLIRAERHDLAEDTLIAGLVSLHVPLADLCLETRTNVVELTQWDTLQQMIFRPLDSGGLCTAVGLDLSNYGERRMTPEGVEPSVEVKFYSDESFPFSVKTRDQILAENASVSYSVPWHGCREDFATFVMDVVGLARLNRAVEPDAAQRNARQWPPTPAPAAANYVAFRLAEWLLALRYHRAVKHHLDREGLARRLPVIVGSHDVGPFLEAVYYPARRASRPRRRKRAWPQHGGPNAGRGSPRGSASCGRRRISCARCARRSARHASGRPGGCAYCATTTSRRRPCCSGCTSSAACTDPAGRSPTTPSSSNS